MFSKKPTPPQTDTTTLKTNTKLKGTATAGNFFDYTGITQAPKDEGWEIFDPSTASTYTYNRQ